VGRVPASRTPAPGFDAAKDIMVNGLIRNRDFILFTLPAGAQVDDEHAAARLMAAPV